MLVSFLGPETAAGTGYVSLAPKTLCIDITVELYVYEKYLGVSKKELCVLLSIPNDGSPTQRTVLDAYFLNLYQRVSQLVSDCIDIV